MANHTPSGNETIKEEKIRLSNRYAFFALAAGAFFVLLLFAGLSFFARPAADDFCLAAKVRELGFFQAVSFWYFNWAGRYTSNFTLSIFGALGDVVLVYPYAAIFVFAATWLAFCFLARTISRCIIFFRFPLITGTIATVLFLTAVPDPAQTFYWVSGSFTYQLGNVFVIFLVALMIRREKAPEGLPARAFGLLGSAVFAVAAIGANEVSMILTSAVIAGGFVYAMAERRSSVSYWATLTAIGLGAVLACVLAPGNFQRLASLSTDALLRPAPWLAVFLYLPWVALRIVYWLSFLGLWASAIIVLIVTADKAREILYAGNKFRRGFLAVLALWIGAIFLLNAIGFLINRYPLPERAESVVFLLFMLGWYPSFVIAAHWLAGPAVLKTKESVRLAATVLLLIGIIGAPNVFEGYKDTYRGYRYAQEMNERFAAIEAARRHNEREIILNTISRPPRTLFAADLTTDPANHRNACLAQYYGFDKVRLGTTPPAVCR